MLFVELGVSVDKTISSDVSYIKVVACHKVKYLERYFTITVPQHVTN